MVLKWLGGGKSGHPLADEKEAREIFKSLRAVDPFQGIEDARHWIESASSTDELKPERCVELLQQIEEAVNPHLRKLSREHLTNPRLPKSQETRLWGAVFGFWKDFATACGIALNRAAQANKPKAAIALASVRALQAAAAQLKWHYVHYESAEPAAWETLVGSYRAAEERKAGQESVALPTGPTTAEREFVKALMLAASSPDCLLPNEIELAERITAHLSGNFILGNAHKPRVTHYCVDLSVGAAPKRVIGMPPAAPGLRFFAAGNAPAQLDELIAVSERGGIASVLNLGDTWEGATVLKVLRHLKTYWASSPPVRKHDRHMIQHRMNLVHDMSGVIASLDGRAAEGADLVTGAGAETWMTENISAGGMSLKLESMREDWMRVGRLVGIRVDGGSGACSAAVIRRCNRLPRRKVSLGVSSLGKEIFNVKLEGLVAPDALLFLNEGRRTINEVLVCVGENAYEPKVSPTMNFDDKTYLLVPIELCERGADFELVRYRAMLRS